jgi:hypothetical protein
VIYYRLNRLIYEIGLKWLVKVKFITLVNLLAADEPFSNKPIPYRPDAPGAELVPFPEYPSWQDKSDAIAGHIVSWLSNAAEHKRKVGQLVALRALHGSGGASDRAAKYILEALGATPPVPAPHLNVAGQRVTNSGRAGLRRTE